MIALAFPFSTIGIFLICVNLSFGQNSVLSSGEWHKLSVTETGIHKIDYYDLLNLGIDPTLINPKHIRIYGNGSKILPEVNDAFRYTDLIENAIWVAGEDDNTFDTTDYILFYGQAPVEWSLNENEGYFRHKLNIYSHETCYFLNFDSGPGKRVEQASVVSSDPTHFITSYNAYLYHELDQVNLIRSGRRWFGELFDQQTSYSWTFNLPSNTPFIADVAFAARSTEESYLNISINGSVIKSLGVLPVSYTSHYALFKRDTAYFNTAGNQFTLELEYIKPNDSAVAWLDYFTLNYRDSLVLKGDQLIFRDFSSVGPGNVTTYNISGADMQTSVWNITDPMNIQSISGTLTGDVFEFREKADSLQEFLVFRGDNFISLIYQGVVNNQNLRGTDPVDYIIITHDDFVDQALLLASFHETQNDLTTLVVTPIQVYNEFSSGVKDITAIRDFVKLMYDKSDGEQPQYLLLFGAASFDYRHIMTDNSCLVPLWQSQESLNYVGSMCTDDYFGWLGDGEGITGFLDIGIGRLPVSTTAQASSIVEKIINYVNDPGTFGNWKNEVLFVADDGDVNIHLNYAEQLTEIVTDNHNVSKNYLDFYTLVQTPEGPRYPEAKALINKKMNDGLFLVNYIGHGFPESLAAERVVEMNDIESWENSNRLPVMIASACNFARFDDPEVISGGVQAVLKENGGVIGLFGAARLTFAGSSYDLNKKLIEHLYDPESPGKTMGSMMLHAKKMQTMTQRVWTLLGDPALKIAFPKFRIQTDSINGLHVSNMTDTISPGSTLTVAGHVMDAEGNVHTDFNGTLLVKVFERPYERTTLGNDPGSVIVSVELRDSVLLTIDAGVVSGRFNFDFMLPTSMSEDYGNIKLSYYAYNLFADASGYYDAITIGGQTSNAYVLAKDDGSVKVYPTITRDHFYIKTSDQADFMEVRLFDLTGKPVFNEHFSNITTGSAARINLPNLKTGLYFVTIHTYQSHQTVKLIIR